VSLSLDPILSCVDVVAGLVHQCVVPRFKIIDTELDPLYSVMQMAKYFAKSESKFH
jgi:hypothetical protein